MSVNVRHGELGRHWAVHSASVVFHIQGYEKTTRRGGGSALRNTAGQCSRAGGDPRVGRHPDAHPE